MARQRRAKGDGGIYQRRDGTWAGQVDLGVIDGKRKRKTVVGKTQREVVAQLTTLRHTLQQGVPVATERQTVGQFLARWLEDSVRPKNAPKTYQSYAGEIRRNIAPALGHLRLDRLTPQDVQRFLIALGQTGGAGGRGLSARSVLYNRAILRRALAQAVRWGLAPRNVATLVDPPRAKRADVRPYTAAEARRLLAAACGDRLAALYAVALELGLRWEDVDLGRGRLRVRRQLQWLRGAPPALRELKTRGSKRTLDLSPALVADLGAHRERQRREREAAGARWRDWGPGLVFPSAVGTPLEARNLVRRFKALIARAGLPDRRFHDLRHTCASLLFAAGAEAAVVSRVLGHGGVAITIDTYIHLLPETRRAVAGLLSGALRGEEPAGAGSAGAIVRRSSIAVQIRRVMVLQHSVDASSTYAPVYLHRI